MCLIRRAINSDWHVILKTIVQPTDVNAWETEEKAEERQFSWQ